MASNLSEIICVLWHDVIKLHCSVLYLAEKYIKMRKFEGYLASPNSLSSKYK
jgi:hypothetical protein